jgi:transcriptional regulator with XRE-family HTH domain
MISKLERDSTDPRLSSLYKLMNALECTADELLVDVNTSSTPTILKTQFQRISALPEEDQKAIIHVVDQYCKAVAYDSMIEGRGYFTLKPILGKTENVLKGSD